MPRSPSPDALLSVSDLTRSLTEYIASDHPEALYDAKCPPPLPPAPPFLPILHRITPGLSKYDHNSILDCPISTNRADTIHVNGEQLDAHIIIHKRNTLYH